jgi:5-methylcytosine-specific restriction endonuclease McrA
MISDTQYRTQEWLSKRKQILTRDNFSCQSCRTFNPSEGWVSVYNKCENDLELHNYDSNTCEYFISSQKSGITLTIDYGWGIWLVTPILQVHHKKYINGKRLWEYENDDLITLCNDCHNETHMKNKIPVFDMDSNLTENKLFTPEDNNTGRTHKFKPWVFINNYTGEYELSAVHPSTSFFVFAEDIHRINELEVIAKKMYSDFMEQFLPDYYRDTH